MSQIEKTNSPYGVLFSVDGRLELLAEEAWNEATVNRLRAIISNENRGRDEALQELLQLGTDWLEVEHAHLTRFDVADGIHEIAEVSGPHPTVTRKEIRDSSRTFCRRVLSENAVLAVQNATEELGTISALLGGDPLDEHDFDGEQEITNVEWQIADAEGTPHDLLINIRRVSIQKGSRMYTCRDVTERKERERQLEAVFEQTYQFTGLLEPDGTLIRANETALQFGGLEEEDVIGQPVWETYWFQMGSETKERLRASVRPVDGEDGEVAYIIPEGRDITERIQASQELRETKQLLEKTFESLSEVVLVVDPSEREIITCNAAVEEIFGYKRKELIGESTKKIHKSPETYERFAAIGEPILDEEGIFRHEYQMRRKDGEIIDTEHVVTPLQDENWPGVVVSVIRDVTEQRRMMERLLAVQEEERRRIDQEIHDEMGGLLTSIQFNVGLARRTAEENGAPPDHFDQLQDLVDDLATVSRTISRKLYPSDLSEHGLVAGLRSMVDEIERKRNLDIDFYSEVEAEERFSTLIERTVCWIVQEALLKIGPHADNEAAQVIVSTKGKQLHLHVFDQGTGLTSAAPNEDSFELEAIRRRAVWLDGNVRVDSIPDEGIRLSVTLPARLPFLDRMT